MTPFVRAAEALDRWVSTVTTRCEFCTIRVRVMEPSEALVKAWHHVEMFRADDGNPAVRWIEHNPAACRERRPEDATAWTRDALPA